MNKYWSSRSRKKMRPLQRKQRTLTLKSAGVAAKLPVRANDPMARDEKQQRISP